MRVIIAVIVLIFSLQSWTKAEDISDFQIEGMSIGDSLLDYLSEQEIKNNVSKLQTTIRKKKYYDVKYKRIKLRFVKEFLRHVCIFLKLMVCIIC